MLIVTGVLISLVLVVMVGNTMRTLQGVGWISITPIDVDVPLWMGTWLGVFPTWRRSAPRLAAFAFVIGSYFLAEWVRKRSVRKAISEQGVAAEDQEPGSAGGHRGGAAATRAERGHRRTAPRNGNGASSAPELVTGLAS